MKSHWLFVAVLTATFVQAYFLSGIGPVAASSNLVLVLLFYIAIKRSWQLAVVLAVWGGLWLDIAAGQLGPRIALFVAVVLLTKWLVKLGLEMERLFNQIAAIMVFSYLYSLLITISSWVVLGQVAWRTVLLAWWSGGALINAGIAWLLGRRLQLIIDKS